MLTLQIDDFDSSSINAVKAALMGPLSGIGDSLLLGTLRVLAVGIGTSLAVQDIPITPKDNNPGIIPSKIA